jgi:hypothetical protein
MSGNAYPAVPGGPKRTPGLALARKNQKLIAEHTGWPEGALQACWELEGRFPGWHVDWMHENTIKGFERPAGFRALHTGIHELTAFAATTDELEPLMDVPEHDYSYTGCRWCLDRVDERIRRAGL